MINVNNILSALIMNYRYPYGNTDGIIIQDEFFVNDNFANVLFGRTYYVEHEGVLCQIRLKEITYMPTTHDWQFVFDMAYCGNIIKYIWGRYKTDCGYGKRTDKIFESVEDFSANRPIENKRVSFMSLFDVLTDYRYRCTYSGSVGIKGFNYMKSYAWNGCKAVAKLPNLFLEMCISTTITADGIYVGGRKNMPFQFVNDVDMKLFFSTKEECAAHNMIAVSTFDNIESAVSTPTRIKVSIEITTEQKKILESIGICVE